MVSVIHIWHSQVVSIDGMSSKSCFLHFGIPQCLVTEPFKIISHTSPFHDIEARHGLNIHMYADDSQMYIEFDLIPQAALVAKERIEGCVADIRSWMCDSKLILKEDKTELIVITPSAIKQSRHWICSGWRLLMLRLLTLPIILVPHLMIIWPSSIMSHIL